MPEGGAAAGGLLMGKGPGTPTSGALMPEGGAAAGGVLMPEGGAAAGGAAAGPPTGWGPGMWTGAGTPGAAARLIGLNVDCLSAAIAVPRSRLPRSGPLLIGTLLCGLIPGNAAGCLWFGSFDSSWLSFRYLALAS
jgi:hypothetical protein